MKVIRIEKSILPWKETVVFEAEEDEYAELGHFLGTKEFSVDEGERVRMRVPKSWCLETGDNVNLEDLVLYHQEKFDWRWV